MTTEFKLTGLSIGNRCTLSVDGTDKDWFHATTNLPEDRFLALFNYFKGDRSKEGSWAGKNHIAVVEHVGLDEDGVPRGPVVINVILDL